MDDTMEIMGDTIDDVMEGDEAVSCDEANGLVAVIVHNVTVLAFGVRLMINCTAIDG